MAVALGEHVRRLLFRCWDEESAAPPLSSSELAEITPLLLGQGAAPLAYHRLRGSALLRSQAGELLRDAYRLHVARSGLFVPAIERLTQALNQEKIPFLIFKGAVAAQLYPAPGLRPFGDVDLLVPSDALHATQTTVRRFYPKHASLFDLHATLSELPDRSFESLWQCARVATLGSATVPTLGLADTLALYSLHLIKHGGARPLWLCDVALHLERHQEELTLDAVRALSDEARAWVVCIAAVAASWLGPRAPAWAYARSPAWVEGALCAEWSKLRPYAGSEARLLLAQPRLYPALLRARWPSALVAVSEAGRGPDADPRPCQLAAFVRAAAGFLRRSHARR